MPNVLPNTERGTTCASDSARAVLAAELRVGRRGPDTWNALDRAAVCEAQADDCARDARANLARAHRARDAGSRRDGVRFAACALTCERSAAVWRDRAAAHLASYWGVDRGAAPRPNSARDGHVVGRAA